ncbi:MAG: WYL domain-containing protein [Coriobacteriaceae bacterium]|nr:WYL domain-containing protein [Coriobacteriaceae bacterium]MDO4890401.1 WYL domain-containing protein [Coriobacteriaceae bacterium]
MPKHPNQTKKIPLIIRMLREETDDEHGLTMSQIIERLAEEGVEAERKSIYRDFEVLRECGYDVVKRTGRPTEYALGQREFEYPELLLLVDAVQSSRFLTTRKSRQLLQRIKGLTSIHQADALERHVHVERRIRTQNESVYYNVDAIQEAIASRRKVGFRYFKHDLAQRKVYRKDGALYRETPVHLVYSDGYYYLIAFNDAHDDFVRYRIDRMSHIQVLDEPATRNDRIARFDVEEFALQAFGMFGGDKVRVTIEFQADAIDQILDRFGSDGVVIIPQPDGITGHATVTVRKSTVFFGWLAGFGTRARIIAPSSLAQEYRDYLAGIIEQY